MFEYQKDRFVDPKKIIAANIYSKDNAIRVALDIDTVVSDKSCLYAGPFDNIEKAKTFIGSIPVK